MSKHKVHLSLFHSDYQLCWDLVACGRMVPMEKQSESPSAVTCLRCKSTKAYREAVEKEGKK